MYSRIRERRPLNEIYGDQLIEKGVVKVTKVLDADVSWFWTKEYVDAVGWYVENRPDKLHYVKGCREWSPAILEKVAG